MSGGLSGDRLLECLLFTAARINPGENNGYGPLGLTSEAPQLSATRVSSPLSPTRTSIIQVVLPPKIAMMKISGGIHFVRIDSMR